MPPKSNSNTTGFDTKTPLTLFRIAALECRTAARVRPAGGTAPRSGLDPLDGAQALVTALPHMMIRRPIFWRPETSERSFDETWLLALIAALEAGDWDSIRFLLERRVWPWARRPLLVQLKDLLDNEPLKAA